MNWGRIAPFIVGLGMMIFLIFGGMPIHSPVLGLVITDVKGPITVVTSTTPGPKTGKAVATTIFGLVAYGDTGIEAAARNGGITRVMTVDYDSYNILGVYARFTTIVTGE
ncbi:MAG: TRL-like family protein [bacterium]